MNNYKVVLVHDVKEEAVYDVEANNADDALKAVMNGDVEISDYNSYGRRLIRKDVLFTGKCTLYKIRIFSNKFPSCYDIFIAWAKSEEEIIPTIEDKMNGMTVEYGDSIEDDFDSFDWTYKITDWGKFELEECTYNYYEIIYDGRPNINLNNE